MFYLILDIHTSYDQLTAVKIVYPLTSIKTVLRAHVYNPLTLQMECFKSFALNGYGMLVIACSEHFTLDRYFLKASTRALPLALAKSIY